MTWYSCRRPVRGDTEISAVLQRLHVYASSFPRRLVGTFIPPVSLQSSKLIAYAFLSSLHSVSCSTVSCACNGGDCAMAMAVVEDECLPI